MASELRAVVDELGGGGVLGPRLTRDVDLQAAIREGFPQKVIEELMEAADLTIKELAACLDLSPRTDGATQFSSCPRRWRPTNPTGC